jgi:hypothetical protein
MKKIFLYVVAILCAYNSTAQGLHEIKMADMANLPLDTYVEDINDNGFICGYYNAAANKGFVLNQTCEIVDIDVSLVNPNITQTKVVGINNQNTIAIHGITNVNTQEMLKGYYDAQISLYSLSTVANNQQASLAKTTKMNNLNDFCGWYQGVNSRWLYICHDSIVPVPPAWKADRYMVGPTYYNTMTGGMNDNNIVVGYYIDGSDYIPYLYDGLTGTFTLINTALDMRVHDINNANKIVGEYKQGNSIWMGFSADVDVLTGQLSNFFSFNALFEVNTISSYAKGINNVGTIVGSYVHPTSGQFVGFVYFPTIADSFGLHNFDMNTHVWTQIENDGTGAKTMWPPSLYAGIDYYTQDPYANNGIPLIDTFIMTKYPHLDNPFFVPPHSSPEWSVFGKLIDSASMALSGDPYLQQKYKLIYKHRYFDRYHSSVFVREWAGMCYGFTNAVLRKHYTNNTFSTVYNLNPGDQLSAISNASNEAIRSIESEFVKQLDIDHAYYFNKYKNADEIDFYPHQAGLYYLKWHYSTDFNKANPRGLNLRSGNAAHSVMPYKIKSPRKLPFDYPVLKFDTIYVYENSTPLNTNKKMFIHPVFLNRGPSEGGDSVIAGYNMKPCFFLPGVRDAGFIKNKIITNYKKERSFTPDSLLSFSTRSNNYYTLTTGTGYAKLDMSGYSQTANDIQPLRLMDSSRPDPILFVIDSNAIFQLNTSNYTDSVISWNLSSNHMSMGVNREALPNEKDYATVNKNSITYGNPDNITKELSCYSIFHDDNKDKAFNILTSKLKMNFQDSIITTTHQNFTYSIQKVTGGATTYDLWIYADNGDSILQFIASQLPLDANTTHTIDPFYFNGTALQTVVYVDNGNNGTLEDTLFIASVPLGQTIVNSVVKNIFIYPNPVEDFVFIKSTSDVNMKMDITLSDLQGRKVFNSSFYQDKGIQSKSIDLRTIASGTYILTLYDDKGSVVHTQKIRKQ